MVEKIKILELSLFVIGLAIIFVKLSINMTGSTISAKEGLIAQYAPVIIGIGFIMAAFILSLVYRKK